MNIFLFVDKYLPKPLSCASMMFDLSSELVNRGHTPYLFTIDNTISKKRVICTEQGIKVIRTSSINSKTSNKILRACSEMLMSNLIIHYNKDILESIKCDLLIVYSPSIFWTKIIKKVKTLNNCKTYLVLRDLFPQWLVDTGIISKGGIVAKYFRFKEKQLYHECDIIGVQSPLNHLHFETGEIKKYKSKVEILYNWTRIEKNKTLKNQSFRQKYGLDGKIIFIYAGNIGFAQDISNIVRLAENLKSNKELFFVIIGDGTEKRNIERSILNKELKNILLLDSVKENELIEILKECNVGIISLSEKLKTENIPGKLLSYCRAGLPILASVNKMNDLEYMLNEFECGFLVQNGNDKQFVKSALSLNDKIIKKYKFRRKTNSLLKKYFDVEKAANQILAHYE